MRTIKLYIIYIYSMRFITRSTRSLLQFCLPPNLTTQLVAGLLTAGVSVSVLTTLM